MSILERLPKVEGDYREKANLGKICWFQVGGDAEVLFKPKNTNDLANFLKNKPSDIPHTIIGVGSNLLIRDTGFKGVVIRLGREFNFIKHENHLVHVGAASLDVNVALYTENELIAGLEFLAGIPGTIGGALAMNAGAYGSEIKDVLVSATAVNEKGEIREFTNSEIGYVYRGKTLGSEWIFTECKLQGCKGEKAEIKEKIEKIQNARATTQPIKSRTGGSTFKNPEGHKAWELIDKAGCRGLQIGGARVSDMHCNFFINTGDATASDLEKLIKEVQKRVLENSGIALHPEIKIIG